MYIWFAPNIVGVFNDEGPPVPIPNTEVKLIRAEDTCLVTGRENRSMPTQSRSDFRSALLFPSSVFWYASKITANFNTPEYVVESPWDSAPLDLTGTSWTQLSLISASQVPNEKEGNHGDTNSKTGVLRS